MPLVFNLDIEKDPIFIDGREQGVEIEKISTIEKFLLESELPIKRIADFVGLSVEYVLNIQERLKKEGKF